jgi:uncharacterized protein (DUF433 family)
MSRWYERYIDRVDGVQGGEPVVRGTRTPVRSVFGYARALGWDAAALQEALPHLTRTHIEAALAYARDHQDEIDRLARRHRDAARDSRSMAGCLRNGIG